MIFINVVNLKLTIPFSIFDRYDTLILAEKMDISQNYLASIECGKENMSLGKILVLAQALETDIENLLKFS